MLGSLKINSAFRKGLRLQRFSHPVRDEYRRYLIGVTTLSFLNIRTLPGLHNPYSAYKVGRALRFSSIIFNYYKTCGAATDIFLHRILVRAEAGYFASTFNRSHFSILLHNFFRKTTHQKVNVYQNNGDFFAECCGTRFQFDSHTPPIDEKYIIEALLTTFKGDIDVLFLKQLEIFAFNFLYPEISTTTEYILALQSFLNEYPITNYGQHIPFIVD